MARFDLHGKTIVVTGAAHGIGACLAQTLHARGARLALVDRDSAALADVAARTDASAHVVDLAAPGTIAPLVDDIVAHHRHVDALINNAGAALLGTFMQLRAEEFDALMTLNFASAVHLTRAMLPHLLQRPVAQIVNVSSLFGLVGVPGQTAYCASKFALRGFSEALRAELRDGPVGISVVHPGGIRTAIAVHARRAAALDASESDRFVRRFDRVAHTTADVAAQTIVRGLERRANRILIGADARLIDRVQRLFPARYLDVLGTRLAPPRKHR